MANNDPKMEVPALRPDMAALIARFIAAAVFTTPAVTAFVHQVLDTQDPRRRDDGEAQRARR